MTDGTSRKGYGVTQTHAPPIMLREHMRSKSYEYLMFLVSNPSRRERRDIERKAHQRVTKEGWAALAEAARKELDYREASR